MHILTAGCGNSKAEVSHRAVRLQECTLHNFSSGVVLYWRTKLYVPPSPLGQEDQIRRSASAKRQRLANLC